MPTVAQLDPQVAITDDKGGQTSTFQRWVRRVLDVIDKLPTQTDLAALQFITADYLQAIQTGDVSVPASTAQTLNSWHTGGLELVPVVHVGASWAANSDGSFTCIRAGDFVPSFGVRVNNAASGDACTGILRVKRNGTVASSLDLRVPVTAAGTSAQMPGVGVRLSFKVGDNISLVYSNTVASARTVGGATNSSPPTGTDDLRPTYIYLQRVA